MKSEQRRQLLHYLLDAKIFRNDTHGNLFAYNPKLGIWEVKSKVEGRACIAKCLDSHSLLRPDLEALQEELEENILFAEASLSSEIPSEFVTVRNGRLNLRTGQLEPHDPSAFSKVCLDFQYKKVEGLPKFPVILDFFATSLGLEKKEMASCDRLRVFCESVVYLLSNLPNAKKAVVYIGPPNAGKSVMLKLLARLVGNSNWVPLSWNDLAHRFLSSLMEHRCLVITHELSGKPIHHLDILKAIVSGDPIVIEEKGIQPKTYEPNIKLVAAANNLPPLGEPDAGGAFCDRLLVIPFDKADVIPDPLLIEKLWGSRDEFFSYIFQFAENFIKRKLQFIPDQKGSKILQHYKKEGNSVAAFLTKNYEECKEGKVCLKDLYDAYSIFCDEALLRPADSSTFKTQLSVLGYKFGKRRLSLYPNPRSCILGIQERANKNPDEDSTEVE